MGQGTVSSLPGCACSCGGDPPTVDDEAASGAGPRPPPSFLRPPPAPVVAAAAASAAPGGDPAGCSGGASRGLAVPAKLPLHTSARLPLAAASLFADDDDGGGGRTSAPGLPLALAGQEARASQADEPALRSLNRNSGEVVGRHRSGSRSSRLSNTSCAPSEFPRRPLLCRLSPTAWSRIEELFARMSGGDQDGITPTRAMGFFTGAFRKMSVDAMFNEVDVDNDGSITGKEFADFWIQVRRVYKEEQILQEVDLILEGSPWVDWDDQRDVKDASSKKDALSRARFFPKRPVGCKLSEETWAKIEDLYFKLLLASTKDAADKPGINWEDAKKLFTATGTFGQHSANAMFDEVDVDRSGCITAKEFCDFWLRVRKNYAEETISEELSSLCEGGTWVDWRGDRAGGTNMLSRSSMTAKTSSAHGTAPAVFFPKRPRWCCLSKQVWLQIEELYGRLAREERRGVTREDAQRFFKGAFAGVSAQNMFTEVDADDSGNITGQEFADYWIQIRKAGYPESKIADEIQKLLSGDSWVDFGQQP